MRLSPRSRRSDCSQYAMNGKTRGVRLKGRVALITGGARGQGQAIALRLAADGADLVVCDVGGVESLEETVAGVVGAGSRCLARVADVCDQAALGEVVGEAICEFGGVDILVANAGVTGPLVPFWEVGEDDWRRTLEVNLSGAWRAAKAVAPHMIERMSGCIVFNSSMNGVEGDWNISPYASSKHGMLGLMKCLALELAGFGVRVNAILPGAVDTPMLADPVTTRNIVGREGASRDECLAALRPYFALRGRSALPASAIADGVAWLVSDEAQHVTGLELIIDGGHGILPGVNLSPVAPPGLASE